MRIVAGEHRSRKLNTLSGDHTRPTQDKIKEAIYSSLGTYFHGGKMLDLFAGSGNMGLEALSRGMEKVYFNDHNRAAVKVIESNIHLLKVENLCKVECLDYEKMLEKVKDEKFTLIFLDPPYAQEIVEVCIRFIEKHQMLEENGTLIIESANEKQFDEEYGDLRKKKEKKYGITRITYYQKEL